MKKSTRSINRIVVHCTATKEGQDFKAKDIDQWHKQRGWSGIGYNYVVDLNGKVELGRDVNQIPAQAYGYNKHSIGVVYVGGLDANLKPKDTRTDEQKKALIQLIKQLKALYPNAEILGHGQLPGVKKACPCFDAKKEYKNI